MPATGNLSDIINPEYLLKRLDDATLKTYLGQLLAQSSVVVGKIGTAVSGYSGLVQGTYNLVDQNGELVVLPNCSIIKRAYFVTDVAFTSGGSATLSVGYSGSNTALINAEAVAGLTADSIQAGVPIGTEGTMLLRKVETQLTVTIGTADMLTGLGYVVVEYYKLPQFT